MSQAQHAFAQRHADLGIFEPDSGVVIVLPSLTLPEDELAKVTGIQFYEERLLFLLLTLRRPDVSVVYLTSIPVDPSIIDYYLAFLDDPCGARERLHLVHLGDATPRPLSRKLVDRSDILALVQGIIAGRDAWLLPFNVTATEERIASALAVPIYGPAAAYARFGAKSGARELAERTGVPTAEGSGDLRSLPDLERAAARFPATQRIMLKLDDSYSGLGNVIIEAPRMNDAPLTAARAKFSAPGESWATFLVKVAERGAVMEEYLDGCPLSAPSVLVRITPGGTAAVVASHDQILGGPNGDVYLGCRFPADAGYRDQIQHDALLIARRLAASGVIGMFGMDFFAVRHATGYRTLLCEINLRLGGTTHPFGTALLSTGARYDPESGNLFAGDIAKFYVTTDNLEVEHLIGRSPAEVIHLVARRGLGFSPRTKTGSVLHMLGSVPRFGKLGFTSIADSPDDADELFMATLALFDASDEAGMGVDK